MQALVFHQFGDADVLRYEAVPDPVPGPGQALVRMRAVGLNFADVYRRKGNYHLAGSPPWILGYEGAGEVVTAPEGSGLQPGQRVGFADSPFANAALCAVDVSRLIPLPDDTSFETAAGSLLQGLTAQYLCRDSYTVRPGDWAVVHAAAGGVGLLLVQILKHLGARVIGIASTDAKRQAVREVGADVVIPTEGWSQAVKSLTDGRGADVVYDSVGSTLRESLGAARTGGTVVFYGMAAGDPAPVDPRLLMDRSLTLVGGDLWNVLTTAEERRTRATELFSWIRSGDVTLRLSQTLALRDGAQAHRALESRQTIGKIVLLP
ncbi:quinone oxidoreductase [Mitsuaria sp. 7]|uniref:quinone oxidoreductase family protein n=1 Tax=Mitsuaria sp. 7 TaxID=1658665 RepID=UPI0007DD42A1|nr:quinone oxidoreductase [Mitsuaria sp. 7]ANH70064.1 alcohol dehydrogenase [Mitsuaria sp. 7]